VRTFSTILYFSTRVFYKIGLETAQDLHVDLFIEENATKAIPPTQLVVILRYEVDTVPMTVTIPEKKLDKICDLYTSTLVLKKIHLQEIQKLISYLYL
jgi:hypothetical protein